MSEKWGAGKVKCVGLLIIFLYEQKKHAFGIYFVVDRVETKEQFFRSRLQIINLQKKSFVFICLVNLFWSLCLGELLSCHSTVKLTSIVRNWHQQLDGFLIQSNFKTAYTACKKYLF
jgi:hypothetical protein